MSLASSWWSMGPVPAVDSFNLDGIWKSTHCLCDHLYTLPFFFFFYIMNNLKERTLAFVLCECEVKGEAVSLRLWNRHIFFFRLKQYFLNFNMMGITWGSCYTADSDSGLEWGPRFCIFFLRYIFWKVKLVYFFHFQVLYSVQIAS